jgi:hypothetical protein
MALINCPECNKQISDKSKECVGCGAPRHVFIEVKNDKSSKLIIEELTPFVKVGTKLGVNKSVMDEDKTVFDKEVSVKETSLNHNIKESSWWNKVLKYLLLTILYFIVFLITLIVISSLLIYFVDNKWSNGTEAISLMALVIALYISFLLIKKFQKISFLVKIYKKINVINPSALTFIIILFCYTLIHMILINHGKYIENTFTKVIGMFLPYIIIVLFILVKNIVKKQQLLIWSHWIVFLLYLIILPSVIKKEMRYAKEELEFKQRYKEMKETTKRTDSLMKIILED